MTKTHQATEQQPKKRQHRQTAKQASTTHDALSHQTDLAVLQNQLGNRGVQRFLTQQDHSAELWSASMLGTVDNVAQRQEGAAPVTAEQNQVEMQWRAHPTIHRYFQNRLEHYLALLPLYQARGIVNPAHYIQENIVSVTFFGRTTPAHCDLAGPLAAAESALKEQQIKPEITRFWSFNPRRTSRGGLSNHALGRAVDINPRENPHILHAADIRVIQAVTGTNLGQRLAPETLRQASETFQERFTQEWVAQQPPALQQLIQQRRTQLDRYAESGFLTLEQSLVDALIEAGFTWGGSWTSSKDFMHFELSE